MSDDDGAGRHFRGGADAEATEGDNDVEAHGIGSDRADAESADSDGDAKGHRFSGGADAESAEGDDDVEAHVYVEEPHDPKDGRI
ncbi:MAG: hypothetical protein H0T17_09720 [Propionibacteriales bacterium]|nr:hypothetical protein [Propionibacteriales bacterium]